MEYFDNPEIENPDKEELRRKLLSGDTSEVRVNVNAIVSMDDETLTKHLKEAGLLYNCACGDDDCEGQEPPLLIRLKLATAVYMTLESVTRQTNPEDETNFLGILVEEILETDPDKENLAVALVATLARVVMLERKLSSNESEGK